MKLAYLFVIIAGCATTQSNTQDDFYHRLSVKPEITETPIPDGRRVNVHNPFQVPIQIVVDCDDEIDNHILNIKPNSDAGFDIGVEQEFFGRACFSDGFTVKE